jgi:hypothetical protein
MKGYNLGYHNKSFSFNASIAVSVPESGFSMEIGKTGENSFDPVVSFSGYSGYLFDQSGLLVHGYRQNQVFNVSGNYFYGDAYDSGDNVFEDSTGIARFSYFINDNLIRNNISGQTGFIDSIIFEDYGNQNTLSIEIFLDTGSPCVIADNTGTYTLSSEGYYLAASNCI